MSSLGVFSENNLSVPSNREERIAKNSLVLWEEGK